MDKREGKYQDFPSKIFCLAVPKNFSVEPFCDVCFRKVPVANKFMDEKGGGHQNIPSKIFCLKVSKKFVREPFSVSLISCIENFSASEGYFTYFLRVFFVSQCPKNAVREPFSLSLFRVSKNVRDKRGGGYHDFLSKLFCLTVPKNFVGEPLRASQNF